MDLQGERKKNFNIQNQQTIQLVVRSGSYFKIFSKYDQIENVPEKRSGKVRDLYYSK